jgi:hypothetical protein
MGKRMLIVFTIISVLMVTGLANGQVRLSVGGHYWNAKPSFEDESLEFIETNAGNLFGPHANIRFGKLSLGTSMFFGTFSFGVSDELNIDLTDWKVKRQDLNYSIGYSLFPRSTIFLAIKTISYEGNLSSTDGYTYDWETEGNFIGGGLQGVLPMGSGSVFLYWSIAYLSGTAKETSTDSFSLSPASREYDSNMLAGTVGIGMAASSGLSVMIGYRADVYGVGNDQGEERIQGIMITAAYAVR